MPKLALSIAHVLSIAAAALAEDAEPFSDANKIGLVTLLSPPPAFDSPQMKAELGEILTPSGHAHAGDARRATRPSRP